MRASIVVATRNRAHLLERLVDKLLRQCHEGEFEILLVDDFSTDETWPTLQRLTRENEKVRAFRLPSHQGPAAARNVGWRAARGELIAFTDDDCEPQPGWLAALVSLHARGADIAQGKTVPERGALETRGPFSHWVQVEHFSHRYETCNISYRAEVLQRLSGFDQAFGASRGGAPYGEDADLGWRAREAGMSAAFTAEAIVVHDVRELSYAAFLRSRLRRQRLVFFLRQHPGYREFLLRRYIFQAAHPPALVLLLGVCSAAVRPNRFGPILVALTAVPYVRHRIARERVPGRRRTWPVTIPATWLADVVEIGVLAVGSLRWRTLLL